MPDAPIAVTSINRLARAIGATLRESDEAPAGTIEALTIVIAAELAKVADPQARGAMLSRFHAVVARTTAHLPQAGRPPR